jgi:hypothetical protein
MPKRAGSSRARSEWTKPPWLLAVQCMQAKSRENCRLPAKGVVVELKVAETADSMSKWRCGRTKNRRPLRWPRYAATSSVISICGHLFGNLDLRPLPARKGLVLERRSEVAEIACRRPACKNKGPSLSVKVVAPFCCRLQTARDAFPHYTAADSYPRRCWAFGCRLRANTCS